MTTPVFKTKSGLSAYALACGYIQRFELTDNKRDLVVDLWHEGACYHVRAHDHKGPGRIMWESFDTLTEARREWRKAVYLYAGADLRTIQRDSRYTVAREYHGEAQPSYIARFCGEALPASQDSPGAFGCSTAAQAWGRCYTHNAARTAPYTPGTPEHAAFVGQEQ